MSKSVFRWQQVPRLAGVLAMAGVLAGCSMAGLPGLKPLPAQRAAVATSAPPVPQTRSVSEEAFVPFAFVEAPSAASDLDGLVGKYAATYDVPASLIWRVVRRESGGNPKARNGPYLGLMQISHATAQSMGYRGPAVGLLEADTNLKYAVKYLRGAYIVAGYNSDQAIRNYARGYYYDAKRAGLLEEVGLR